MNFITKTTKVHTGTFSADEIKAVALSYATKQAGITDAAAVASSKVDVAADGSVTVEIVETAADAPTSPLAPAVNAPAAPGLHAPSFVKAS